MAADYPASPFGEWVRHSFHSSLWFLYFGACVRDGEPATESSGTQLHCLHGTDRTLLPVFHNRAAIFFHNWASTL